MADHPPLTFPSAKIPIVGQRVLLKHWFPAAVIVCTCTPHPEPIMLLSGMPAECPACHSHYVLAKIHHELNNPSAQEIGIAVVAIQQPIGSPS